jgi:hypothetical protein
MEVNMNYAVVNQKTNIVQNTIVLEENAVWEPPEGHFLVPVIGPASQRDTWDGTKFIPPPIVVLQTDPNTPGSAPNVIG